MLDIFQNPFSEQENADLKLVVDSRFYFVKFLNSMSVEKRMEAVNEFKSFFELDTVIDMFGTTFVHFLVEHADLQTLRSVISLLPKDAINSQDLMWETPLSKAKKQKREKVVELLLAHGAESVDSIFDELPDAFSDFIDELKESSENPHFQLAKKHLETVNTQADFDRFINELNQNDLGLQTPIDKEGNTLLHLFTTKSKQKEFSTLLKFVTPQSFDCQNDLGQTPYMLALIHHRLTIASALFVHGINPNITDYNGNLPILFSLSLGDIFNFIPKSIDNYISANKLLDETFYNCNFVETVSTLLKEGFNLEEPIDEEENTLVHWLVLNAPFQVIRKFLFLYPDTNIHLVNIRGETALMLAAGIGRQLVVDLLINKGASLEQKDYMGCNARIHALEFSKPIEFPSRLPLKYNSIYFNLIIYSVRQMSAHRQLPPPQLVEKLFDIYIAYIRKQDWHYEGVIDKSSDYNRLGRNSYFLDCEVGKSYMVNCFDIANGFVHFLRVFGLKEAKLHVYGNIKSKAFTPKDPKIQGDFVCFDKVAHAKILQNGNYYSFGRHCVVTIFDKVYDPTFCCSYHDINDVIHTDEVLPAAQLTSTPVRRNVEKDNYIQQFKSTLSNSIFPESEWNIVQRKGKLIVSSKSTAKKLELLFENNLMTFNEEENISEQTLEAIREAWKNTLPKKLNLLYDIFVIKQKKMRTSLSGTRVAFESNNLALNSSCLITT